MTDAQRRVCAFVQAHPRLLAALYDLDLMPLDLPPELVDACAWSRTVRIVALYAEAAGLEPPWLVAEANATRRRASPAGAVRVDNVNDAYLGASAVYVMPEPPPQVELPPRPALSAEARATIERCASIAERIEAEALGSPIAQDAARRIKLAILALR